MPFVKRSFFVPICPKCHNAVDFKGEGGYTVVKTKEEGKEWLDGIGADSIAEACGCKDRPKARTKK